MASCSWLVEWMDGYNRGFVCCLRDEQSESIRKRAVVQHCSRRQATTERSGQRRESERERLIALIVLALILLVVLSRSLLVVLLLLLVGLLLVVLVVLSGLGGTLVRDEVVEGHGRAVVDRVDVLSTSIDLDRLVLGSGGGVARADDGAVSSVDLGALLDLSETLSLLLGGSYTTQRRENTHFMQVRMRVSRQDREGEAAPSGGEEVKEVRRFAPVTEGERRERARGREQAIV